MPTLAYSCIHETRFRYIWARCMGTNRRWCWKKVQIHHSEQKWCYFHADVNKKYTLTHCGLVMPYGHIKKSKLVRVMACHLMAPSHYPKWCWLTIRVISCGFDLRAMSQKMLPIFIIHMCLKITNRKFQPHFPVTNELKYKYLSLNKGLTISMPIHDVN